MTIFDYLKPIEEYVDADDNCIYKYYCVFEVELSSKKENDLYLREFMNFLDKKETGYDSSPLLPIFGNKIYLCGRTKPKYKFGRGKYITTYHVFSNKEIIAPRPFNFTGVEERMIYDCPMVPFLYNMIVIDFNNRYRLGMIDEKNGKYHQDL